MSIDYYINMQNEKINIQIGNNLRAERSRLNWSQDELAEKSGLQRQHISKIEKGKIDIRVSTLVMILKALNIKFDQLFDLDNWDPNM